MATIYYEYLVTLKTSLLTLILMSRASLMILIPQSFMCSIGPSA